MLAKYLMKKDVISVSAGTTVEEVARLMIDHDISGIPIVNDAGVILGVVSEADLMHKVIRPEDPNAWDLFFSWVNDGAKIKESHDNIRRYMANTAGQIMTAPAVSVDELDDIETVGRIMFRRRIKRVFVTRNGSLTGVISRSAFVKLLLNPSEDAK